MTVREDEAQTVVAIVHKEGDAAVAATPLPAIQILTAQTAVVAVLEEMEEAVLAQTEGQALQAVSRESSGKTGPTTASRKLLAMMAVQTIAAVQTVEAKESDVLTTDKGPQEEMIGQLVKESVTRIPAETLEDQIVQNAKKDIQINAVEEQRIHGIKGVILAQNLKKAVFKPNEPSKARRTFGGFFGFGKDE